MRRREREGIKEREMLRDASVTSGSYGPACGVHWDWPAQKKIWVTDSRVSAQNFAFLSFIRRFFTLSLLLRLNTLKCAKMRTGTKKSAFLAQV